MISLNIEEIIINYRNTRPISYSAVHTWLRRHFGNANKCENKQCVNPSHAFQWAKVKGKDYDFIRENFVMLCGRCHYYYDEKYKRHQKLKLNKHISNVIQLNLSFD
jgi:hypothetical protein